MIVKENIFSKFISKFINKRLYKKRLYRMMDEIKTAHNISIHLLESIETMIMISETESDKIIYINDKFKNEFCLPNDKSSEWRKLITENSIERYENDSDGDSESDSNTNNEHDSSWVFYYPNNQKYYKITNKHIDWSDGSKVLLEQCIDITEAKLSAEMKQEADERALLMLNTSTLCALLWDKNLQFIDCNDTAVRFFGFCDKQSLFNNYNKSCSPEYQPDGRRSDEAVTTVLNKAFEEGYVTTEWMHQLPYDKTPVPTEITLVRAKCDEEEVVVVYINDLREQKKLISDIEISHLTTSSMFDSNPQINILFDTDFNILDCNPASLLFFGYESKNDLIKGFAKQITAGIPKYQPDGRLSGSLVDHFNTAIKENIHKFNTEIIINGKQKYLEVILKKIPYKENFAIVAYVFDLTDIHARETKLAHINDINEIQLVTLNALVKTAKIALWDAFVDHDDPLNPNAEVKWSEEFKNIIGFTKDDIFPNIFKSWIERLHPVDKSTILNTYAKHIFDKSGNTPFNVEYRLLKKDGTYSYYYATGEAKRDREGRAYRVAGTLADITKTKELQFNLERESTTLQAIFNSIPDIVFCKDIYFNYIQCNRSFYDYFGKEEKDIIGEDDVSGLKLPFKLAKEYRSADFEVMSEDVTKSYEELVPDRDGNLRLFETIRVPLKHQNHVIGLLGIAREITERKAMEDAAQSASRSKSLFLANMSHEIRTPMNSIIGFTELAKEDDIKDSTREYLEKIQDSAGWLLEIINDILDISKIESGNIEFEHIPFTLNDVFEYCQSAIMPKAMEKDIMLYCYSEPSEGKMLLGDPIKLRQVIMNLLSNAVKFTNTGSVKLSATATEKDENSIHLYFEIKDTGIGMTPEQIEKIFSPFAQADDSITRRFGGTGLGLSITKNIIEHMGGKLQVESSLGSGSSFFFDLKFDIINEMPVIHEKVVFSHFDKPVFKGEVLVFEDNALNQQVISLHLAKVGIDAILVNNGREGLDLITERVINNIKPFDLIFMDIHMPVMDGLTAATEIMNMGVRTPVVALTANIMSNDLELYKKSGIYDTLGKPYTSHELWRCLLKYLPVESYTVIDENQQSRDDSTIRSLMITNFTRNNQTTYDDFIKALNDNDIKTAHRIVHTLKSNAGQLGETKLQISAAETEKCLANGKNEIDNDHLIKLKTELDLVLAKFTLFTKESVVTGDRENIDTVKTIELFDSLESLLTKKDTKCIKMIGDLRSVPGTNELITLIQEFKFRQALAALSEIKRSQHYE